MCHGAEYPNVVRAMRLGDLENFTSVRANLGQGRRYGKASASLGIISRRYSRARSLSERMRVSADEAGVLNWRHESNL